MTPVDVTVMLVALATACTIIFVGLGFLPFPSRAASIWSGAFAVVMVGTYLLVAADAASSSPLWAASHGVIFCGAGLTWVGFRARRGREPIMLLPTILVFAVTTAALMLTATTEWYGLVLRLAFLVGGAASVLIVVELSRVPASLRPISLPLVVAACGFAGLSLILAGDGIVRAIEGTAGQTETDMRDIHGMNVLVSVLYLVCGLITMLALAREKGAQTTTREIVDFRLVGQDRLDRAKAAGDRWWSVIDVRLDDPAELLDASSGRAFDRITSRFGEDIRAVMPPEADIHPLSPTQYVILLPRPDTAVRALLSRLLARVATVTDTQAVPVRLSASIGVAAAPLADYDLDRLCAAAAEASEHAQLAGGDRWERAVFVA